MLIASTSKRIIFNNWSNIEYLHTYPTSDKNDDFINSISWSKDGSWLVFVTNKGKTEIISVKTAPLKLLYTFLEIDQPSYAAFSNNTKRFLAIGSSNGLALVYDIKTKSERRRFQRLKSPIFKISYISTDTHLIVGCNNGELMLFSNTNSALMSTYHLQNHKKITNFRCHPDDRNLVSIGSTNGIVAIWNAQINKTINLLNVHDAYVTDAVFMPMRTDLIASIGYDKKLCFYDATSNKIIMKIETASNPTAIDICPQSIGLVVGTEDGTILPYDIRNMKESIDLYQVHDSLIKQVLFQKVNYENLVTNEEMCVDFTPRYEEDLPEHLSESSVTRLTEYNDLSNFNVISKPNSSHKFELSLSMSDSFLNKNKKELTSGSITEGVKKLLNHRPNLLEPQKLIDHFINKTSLNTLTDPLLNTTINDEIINNNGDIKYDNCNAKIDCLRDEIMFEMQDLRSHVNKRFLDVQMTLVKEFLQVEYEFHTLKEFFNAVQNLPENFLYQENLKLKMENEELRSKLEQLDVEYKY